MAAGTPDPGIPLFPDGYLEDLATLDGPALAPLQAEEAEQLWRDLRWRTAPATRPRQGLAWMDRGRAVGYLPMGTNGGTAVLGGVFASRGGPAAAVEIALLDAAFRTAFAVPEVERVTGELLLLSPGAAAWIRGLGPGKVRERLLLEGAWDGPLAPDGRLETWRHGDLPEAGRIMAEIHAAMDQVPPGPLHHSPEGAASLLERVVAHEDCGAFQPGASFVAREPGTGALLGFILATRMGPDQGHVAQVAVAARARQRGLAAALMAAAMASLRAAGCPTTHLAVTADNAPAIALYRSLGFVERHRFPDLWLT